MTYDKDKDVIIWAGEKREFKPKATIQAQIKQYQNGEPKLILVEEGEGFRGRNYSGYILKRIGIEDVDMVLDMIKEAHEELRKLHVNWEKSKGRKA